MQDTPITVTVADVEKPALLVRLLRAIVDKITTLSGKITDTNTKVENFSINYSTIRDSLSWNGPVPLNVQNLQGVLAQPQPAGAPRLDSVPTGSLLQTYYDTQFVVVKNGTFFDLYSVVAGNPTTLLKLISSAASAHALLSTTHTDTVAASPVLGDLIYSNSTPAWTKLAGNTTTNKEFLTQTGNGTISAAPAWFDLFGTNNTWNATQTFNQTVTINTDLNITLGQISSTSQLRARAYQTATTALNTGTATVVLFDTESFDVGGIHSTSSNTSRFTIPTGGDGIWRLMAGAQIDASGLGIQRRFRLLKNGTTEVSVTKAWFSATATTNINIVGLDSGVAGDFYELEILQDSGGTLNTAAGTGKTWMSAERTIYA